MSDQQNPLSVPALRVQRPSLTIQDIDTTPDRDALTEENLFSIEGAQNVNSSGDNRAAAQSLSSMDGVSPMSPNRSNRNGGGRKGPGGTGATLASSVGGNVANALRRRSVSLQEMKPRSPRGGVLHTASTSSAFVNKRLSTQGSPTTTAPSPRALHTVGSIASASGGGPSLSPTTIPSSTNGSRRRFSGTSQESGAAPSKPGGGLGVGGGGAGGIVSMAEAIKLIVARNRKKRNNDIAFTLREKIYCVLDPDAPAPNEKYAHASRAMSVVVLCVVFLALVTMCVESLPDYILAEDPVIKALEIVVSVFFTIEFSLRAVTCENKKKFFSQILTWIDMLSVIPFYVELALANNASTNVFDILRLLRIVRVFRFVKYSESLRVAALTFGNAYKSLKLILFLFLLANIVFSSIMFIAEQDTQKFNVEDLIWIRDDGTVSPYQSIIHSCWWCIVTMTTIGYGDVVPISAFGKCVAAVTMYAGVIFVSLPIVLLTHHFVDVTQKAREDVMKEEEKSLQNHESANDEKAVSPSSRAEGLETNSQRSSIVSLPALASGAASPEGAALVIPQRRESTLSALSAVSTLSTGARPFVPESNQIASNFQYCSKIIPIYYVGTHAFGQLQFRYPPLLVPRNYKALGISGRCIRIAIVLDAFDAARTATHALLETLPLRESPELYNQVGCGETISVEVDIPRLDPSKWVLEPKVFYSPGVVMVVNVTATSVEVAEQFIEQRVLHTLHMTATYVNTSASNPSKSKKITKSSVWLGSLEKY